jgi:ADP-heptose:LPS heptosyltransferase
MNEPHEPTSPDEGPNRVIVQDTSAISRLAVFHLNGVGDLLFSLPALLAIRRAFPSSHITSVIRPYLRELLEPLALADEIVLRPERGQILDIPGFIWNLRRRRFDLAVLFSQSASANIYARLSRTKIRVGFVDTIFPRLLSHVIPLRGISSTPKLLHLTERIGAKPERRDYVGMLKVGDKQSERAKALLQQAGIESKPFVIFSFAQGPGPIPLYKTWPRENFVQVGRHFLKRGLVPVAIGSRADVNESRLITGQIGREAVSLAGQTSLGELAAVIQKARLLVGIDSGPAHLAAALGIPVVALYGPTDPAVTGVQGDRSVTIKKDRPCSPCRKPTCEGRPCMSEIMPEEIIAAAEKLIFGGASNHQ